MSPFFDAHLADEPGSRAQDPVYHVLSGQGEVVLRIYIDNDANPYYGRNAAAENTSVRVLVPSGAGTVLRCRAYE